MSAGTLHAVLIATDGDTLLLPNTAVADVLARDALRPSVSGPGWRVGTVDWKGSALPVVHLRGLEQPGATPPAERTRVVLLQGLGGGESGGLLGLLAVGYPHLVTLNAAALQPLDSDDVPPTVLARCQLASQTVAIPDLAYIEQALAGAA